MTVRLLRTVLLLVLVPVLLLCSAQPEPDPTRVSCASCAGSARPGSGPVDRELLDAVKRHILTRLQLRDRPNITHPVPKAAMVTALRKLHAGKLREDGRLEIPDLDGLPAGPEVLEESSEIISFAEKGSAARLGSFVCLGGLQI